MQVGDLVTHSVRNSKQVGLVIEVGKYRGNADVKVLWTWLSEPLTQNSTYLKVLTTT